MSNFRDMMRRAREDAERGEWSPGAGHHSAIVVSGDAFESQAGDVYAKATLALVKPGHLDDGRQWDHLMGFREAKPGEPKRSAAQLALYGIPSDTLDNLDDIEDLARAMSELEGLEVGVTCKWRTAGEPSSGVWTNVTGSRDRRKSDVPDGQGEFEVGNGSKATATATANVGDDDIPF